MNYLEALEATIKEIQTTNTNEVMASLIEILGKLRLQMVMSQLRVENIKNEIWEPIRLNRQLLVELLNHTNTFFLLLDDENSYIEKLANSLSVVDIEPSESCRIMDRDFIEYFGYTEDYLEILKSNKWLVFLITLALNIRLFMNKITFEVET